MNITPELTPINRYELDQMADGFVAFIESYPSFNRTQLLDEWRETEYSRLDANGQIYLDYTGGGLYSKSQLGEHMELPRTSVLGNPHFPGNDRPSWGNAQICPALLQFITG